MNLRFEKRLWKKGFERIAGLDEVGRGAFAGPAVVAAVSIDPTFADRQLVKIVKDSKRLLPKRRALVYRTLVESGITFATGRCLPQTIDRQGVEKAIFKAMQRSVRALLLPPDFILVDGNRSPRFTVPHQPIVKGDDRVFVIAAASIIAKVTRDHLMVQLSKRYPEYCWNQNKGYGTALHQNAIHAHGICPFHRTSFLKKIL